MATRRTPEEIEAIVDHCVELEQSGGDILAYLWSENYMTPRATWCNFQREWLGRKPYEYTDGRPGERKRIMPRGKIVITNEQKAEAVRIAIEGTNPCTYLKGLGSKNPTAAWANIKSFYMRKHPDIYAKIPKKLNNYIEMPVVKLSVPIKIETPEADKVQVVETPEKTLADAMTGMKDAADTFFGECEKMGIEMEEKKTAQPLTCEGFQISGLRHPELGEFYYDRKFKTIDWRTEDGDEISLGPAWWKMLIEDLPRIMQLLGVEM